MVRTYRIHRIERETALEHGEPPKKVLVDGREQRVAPGDGVAHGLPAIRRIDWSRHQQGKLMLELPEQGRKREDVTSSRGDFNGKRQVSKLCAHLTDGRFAGEA
jgi:hypothetical protein